MLYDYNADVAVDQQGWWVNAMVTCTLRRTTLIVVCLIITLILYEYIP